MLDKKNLPEGLQEWNEYEYFPINLLLIQFFVADKQ